MEVSNHYRVVVQVSDETIAHELLLEIRFPINKTIGELKRLIEHQLERRNLEGDIYFLETPLQRDLIEEYKLGGILFPEDCFIFDSILDTNSLLFADAGYIKEEDADEEDEEDEEELENSIQPNQMSLQQLSNYIHDFSSVLEVLQSGYNAQPVSNLNLLQLLFSPRPNLPASSSNFNINNLISMGMSINQLSGLSMNNNTNMEDVKVGIHRDDLDQLRIDTYSNFYGTKCDTCSVCIEKFKEDDTVRVLKCKHLFHKDCIDHWLDNSIHCPLCREETGRGVPKL